MEFWEKYKKIIIIAAFALAVALMALAIYSLFFKPLISPAGPEAGPGEEAAGPGGLPPAGPGAGGVLAPSGETRLPEGQKPAVAPEKKVNEVARGGLTRTNTLNSVPSLGVTTGGNGRDVYYYSQNDNKFYRLDPAGNSYPLSDKEFYGLENITWSADKSRAILEYPDGANVIYDFNAGEQITLPKHWQDFDFSPNNDGIVLKSLGLDPDNRWLAVADNDGSRVKALEPLGENADTVYPAWSPNGQSIAMYTRGLDFDRQEVFFVGQNNENFKSMVVEGRDFQPLWSPDGQKLVYSVYSSKDDLKPMLWVANASGNDIGTGRKKLEVETWASKCAYADADKLYCAVPESMPEAAGLMPELADNIPDRLYEIDPVAGTRKLIAVPDGDYKMADLTVSGDGTYLYFVEERTGTVNQIRLK